MKRTALRRVTPLRTAKIGAVRRAQPPKDPVGPTTRALLARRSQGRCELCGREAVHAHHRQLRRFGQHGCANLLHLCHGCHHLIHADPAEAYLCGHLLRSGQDPSSEPVELRYGWVYLGNDGEAHPA